MTLLELQKEFKEKLTEFDKDLSDSRLLSRDVIYKIIILCSTIIAFSVTLISLSQLDLKIDVGKLKTSWYLFLATIILGFSALFLEGRLHYALKWRAFQVQDYDKDYKHPLKDKLKVFIICIFSLIFPRNLIFCRIYKTDEEKKHNALLNAKSVQMIAEFEKVIFLLENLFFAVFIFALFMFIKSYK